MDRELSAKLKKEYVINRIAESLNKQIDEKDFDNATLTIMGAIVRTEGHPSNQLSYDDVQKVVAKGESRGFRWSNNTESWPDDMV